MQLVQAHSDAKLLRQQQQKQQQLPVTAQAPAAASCLQGPEDIQLPLKAQEVHTSEHTSSASSAGSLQVQMLPADDVTQQHDGCRPAASAVAAAAGAVAAGAAAVAANAGSRAAAPAGPIDVDPAAVADIVTEPLAAAADGAGAGGSSASVSTQWQEQLEQPGEQEAGDSSSSGGNSRSSRGNSSDPLVDMLLQQVGC